MERQLHDDEADEKGKKSFCAKCASKKKAAKDLTYLVHFLTRELDQARQALDKAEQEMLQERALNEKRMKVLQEGEFKPAEFFKQLDV